MTDFKHKYYLIPLPFLNYVHREGLYKEFKMYMYLKAISNGHLSKIDKSELAKALKFSRGATYTTLKRLIQRNWIGYNSKRNLYHIRSLKSMNTICGVQGRTGVWLDMDDFDNIDEFIDSSVVSEIVRRKKVEHWRAQQKGSAVQLQLFFEISVRYFANYTGQSDMTAQRKLKRARQSKFLLFEKGKNVNLGKHGAAFKKGYPELSDAVFYRNGDYYLRQGNKFQTCLLFKRRRKPCTF